MIASLKWTVSALARPSKNDAAKDVAQPEQVQIVQHLNLALPPQYRAHLCARWRDCLPRQKGNSQFRNLLFRRGEQRFYAFGLPSLELALETSSRYGPASILVRQIVIVRTSFGEAKIQNFARSCLPSRHLAEEYRVEYSYPHASHQSNT